MEKGLNIHIYPSDITSESRMMKITASLVEFGYFSKIWLIGVLSPKTESKQIIDEHREIYRFARASHITQSSTLSKLLATLRWSWAVWKFLRGQHITCINCHSLPVLPLCVALKLRHKAVLVYDTHELETETSVSKGLRKKMAKLLEGSLIRFADITFVVGAMIADWYRDAYAMKRPYVVRNVPDNKNATLLPRAASPLRAKLGLDENALIVLYLGKLSFNRGIERLLDVFSEANNPVHLVFMGDGELTDLIARYGQLHNTIHYLPPVPMSEVVAHARGADMGVSVIDHSCLSYTYAMPNKFFEYLQAGVPVLIGDMPEQRKIIDKHRAGWLLPEDDDAAVFFINSLTVADVRQKQANAEAISGEFSWAKEAQVLKEAYASAFPRA